MSINITFEDFSKICRLCLAYGNLQPILCIDVLNVFSTITNIQVKNDEKLPENICKECVKQLKDISSFIQACKNNDDILRAIIVKYKTSAAEEGNGTFSDTFEDIKSESSDNEESVDSRNKEFFFKNVKVEVLTEPDEADINLNTDGGPVSCENCTETFPNKLRLLQHYKDIINCQPKEYNPSDFTNIIDYLKTDKKNKRSRPRVKKEEEEPEYIKGRKLKGKRRYLCNYCGKNYTRKNGLDRHILSHTGVKPFECKECGKHYITKDTLKTHLLTHTGVKAYKCEVCQKSFTQSSHLSYHMRRHAGEKPYTCTFCGKGFLSSYHLERHKLMHTGVKPYECNQCGKQFVRSTTLRDHLLIHTGEKPFQCQHCGKQFNRKQSLTNHVLVHTGQPKGSSGNIGHNILYRDPLNVLPVGF